MPKVEGLDGHVFDYVSLNTDLIGWILERASGKRFAELVSEFIWQPMHAESDAYITTDRAGNARAAGGMCATLRDIARLGQIVLRDESEIIPRGWIQDMLNNGSKEAFDASSWKQGFERVFGSIAYRSCWLADRETQILMALGIHGQMLIVDQKNGIVLAKTSSQPLQVDIAKIGLATLAFKEFQRLLMEAE